MQLRGRSAARSAVRGGGQRAERVAARPAACRVACRPPAGRRSTSVAATPLSSQGRSNVDVVGFGNLCVDAVLPLDQLPPADVAVRRHLLDALTASPPDRSSWEVGGNCNFMVAAARLGLRVASVGHIGHDVYGAFMDDVLMAEGVQVTTRIASPAASTSSSASGARSHHSGNGNGNGNGNGSHHASASASTSAGGGLNSTLICFVLVDPQSRHAFCSRYDFGPWPLLQGIRELPGPATEVLRAARAIFTNGFIFDELPLAAVQAACRDAIEHGAAIFFDPGPRCQTMLEGPRRAALDLLLDLSTVVLMTEEEARVVSGLDEPEAAARWLLARPGAHARWCVVKLGAAGAVLCERAAAAPAGGTAAGQGGGGVTATRVGGVQVDVVDTVGCGDSFAAAIVMGFTRGWPADVTLALANAVGGATATGRGAGRNVASAGTVLELLARGAREAPHGQRAAFVRAREELLASLAAAAARGQAGRQLGAAAA